MSNISWWIVGCFDYYLEGCFTKPINIYRVCICGKEEETTINALKSSIKRKALSGCGCELSKEKMKDIKDIVDPDWRRRFKENQDKVEATNLLRYGVKRPFQSKEIQEKVSDHFIEKLGVDRPFKNKNVQEKAQETNSENYKNTEYVNNITKKREQTLLENFGVENYAFVRFPKSVKKCASCGKETEHTIKGMCKECYFVFWLKYNKHRRDESSLDFKKKKAEWNKKYSKNNKQKIKIQKRANYLKSKIKPGFKGIINKNIREKRKKDKFFYLRDRLRNSICRSLRNKGYKKKSKTTALLHCSFEEFILNVGYRPSGNHHLDHICPCSQAQNEEELIKLQHYTNFQWLLAEENLEKSNNRTPKGEELCKSLLGREWID